VAGSSVPTHGSAVDEVLIDGCRMTEVMHRPALRISEHEHETVKICILLEGAFVEREGVSIRSPQRMDVLVRLSRRPHANHYGGRGARSLLLEVPPDHRAAAGLHGIEGIAMGQPGTLRAAASLVRTFRRSTDRAAGIRESMRLLLASIAGARKVPPPAWLDAVREHVAEHWAEPLVLDELAALACVHRVYLSQAFHRFFGQTLSGYSRALRLFHAVELLRSAADLTGVAVDCGFFDQSHFIHAFQCQHQVSPGQYRRAMAEADSP